MTHKKEELYGDAIREKLFEFAERGFESTPEEDREKWSRFKFGETTSEHPSLEDAKQSWYPFAAEGTAPEAADAAADD